MTRILGVDPGLSGGLCIYCPLASAASGLRWHVIDIPTAGEGTQRRVTAPIFRDWIMKLDPQHAFIELATVMPKQGIASSGRYMRAVGALEAVVNCMNVPITFVTPQSWKKFYSLKGPDKEQSRALAIRRFPEAAKFIERKKDHGRAESMLLAAYGAAVLAAGASLQGLAGRLAESRHP